MRLKAALDGTRIRICDNVSSVRDALFSHGTWQVNQEEFSLHVAGVGSFYASGGNYVEVAPAPGADQEWVRLYLNGQVLVALLHQRKIINFHASSFACNGQGVMILGETGAGKTSVTASFVMQGAAFLTDDLTPVVLRGSAPCIMPLYTDLRLRENTAEQLDIDPQRLRTAEAGTGKKYLKVDHQKAEDQPLHTILKIETGDVSQPEFTGLSGSEKFSILRSEICSWEILSGMPETEKAYLHQLLEIIRQVRIARVVRPAEIRISDLHVAIEKFLTGWLAK